MAEVVAVDTAWRAIEIYLEDKGIPLPTADDDSPTFFERLEPYRLWDYPTFRDLMTALTLACLSATAEGREMMRKVADVRKVAEIVATPSRAPRP